METVAGLSVERKPNDQINLEVASVAVYRRFPGADPGFFIGGDTPLRDGIADWRRFFLQYTSCIQSINQSFILTRYVKEL